jgi:cysteine sulfinate desulfinase/cysteine desulfurase-like protein
VRRTCNKLPDVSVNGHPCSSDRRLPGNANLHLPGREGDYLVMLLDARGVSVAGRARVHPISAGGRVKIPQGVPG